MVLSRIVFPIRNKILFLEQTTQDAMKGSGAKLGSCQTAHGNII
jgi:hypothetical protein